MKVQNKLEARCGKHMDIPPSKGVLFFVFLFVFCLSFFAGAREAMANNSGASSAKPGSFWLFWQGGMKYGTPRDIRFDGERKFSYATGDTAFVESLIVGVGAFELNLQNSDLAEAKLVGQLLCARNAQSGALKPVNPPATFSVTCLEAGKLVTKNGFIRMIPEDIQGKIADFWNRLSDKAVKEGKKIVKLDFLTDKIEHRDGYLVVSAKFINSGSKWIKFKTPDQWPGKIMDGLLGVAPTKKMGSDKNGESETDWGIALAGRKLLNRDEFKGGIVTLNPGESKIFKFQVIPGDRVLKGEYEFSGGVVMNMECESDWQVLGHVDFNPIKTRITIDRDYPSTPKERKLWEPVHRAQMSSQPVKPGEKFAEDGLYRAVRLLDDANYRGLLLKQFSTGDVATTEGVKMPMEQNSEYNINGPVQWVWEGEAPQLNGPLYSSGYVEGTQHSCRPGANCPRSGRWVLRTRTPQLEYHYDFKRIVTLNQGQPMPSVRDDTGRAEWEWVGPLA